MDTTASIPPQKVIRQLSTNEIALGELRSPPQKLEQHGAQSLKITAEKGQEELFQFACIIQSLGPLCRGPKRNVPGRRDVLSLGKGRPPSPGFRGGPLPFHLTQGLAELKCLETLEVGKKAEAAGIGHAWGAATVSGTRSARASSSPCRRCGHLQPSSLRTLWGPANCSAESTEFSPLRKPTASTGTSEPCSLCPVAPQGFALADASGLSPCLPYSPPPQPRGQSRPSAAAACRLGAHSCSSTRMWRAVPSPPCRAHAQSSAGQVSANSEGLHRSWQS